MIQDNLNDFILFMMFQKLIKVSEIALKFQFADLIRRENVTVRPKVRTVRQY